MSVAEDLSQNSDEYLVVLDDDESIHKLIKKFSGLKTYGYRSMVELQNEVEQLNPSAVFVDIHLREGESGLDFVPVLRKQWPKSVFIVITSDKSEGVITDSLSSGADDFVQKPLKQEELVSRLRLRLKEVEKAKFDSVFKYKDISVELAHKSIRKDGKVSYLSNTEMSLLLALLKSGGMALSRDELKRTCWGRVNVTDGALDRKMHEVRRALNDLEANVEIKSIYGKGFIVK